jgi:hypothetical protein
MLKYVSIYHSKHKKDHLKLKILKKPLKTKKREINT